MTKINLMPADTYIIINKTILSENDRKLMLMLYQPIIGSLAVNFYFTLWSYLDHQEIISCEWTHHHLMSSMGLKLESIIEARERLEAIGLLKTYYKKGEVNSYLYELYSPLNAYDFFANPILNTTLYSNIGKVEYKKLVSVFKLPKIELDEYEDITSSFSDIFTPISDLIINNNLTDIKKHSRRTLELVSNLDLNNIFSLIPEELFNHRSLTNELKELIYKLSFIYSIDDNVMRDIIINSISDNKKIDKDLLQKNCRNYFKFEHNGKLPSLAFKNQPEYLRKDYDDNSKRTKMIYTFETTSPADYLAIKNNGVITSSDREILSYLLIDLDLKPGVVNVLIDYVLRINENKLIKKFIEMIAVQWKRSKIETVERAMELAKKTEVKMKNIKETKTKKQEDYKPEWFDKEVKERKMTKEEQDEIEQILSEYK